MDSRNLKNKIQKIGLFGLSANPPHYGHVKMAQYAKSVLGLDEVWWIVAAQNPLKSETSMAPFEDRFKMCKILAEDYPWLKVSDIENRLGLQKSFDTINALITETPDKNFTWIIGGDNLASFDKWYRWQDILSTLPVAVMARPGQMQEALKSPAYTHAKAMKTNPITVLDNPLVEISSTDLRERLKSQPRSMHSQTKPKVIDHIRNQGLYRF